MFFSSFVDFMHELRKLGVFAAIALASFATSATSGSSVLAGWNFNDKVDWGFYRQSANDLHLFMSKAACERWRHEHDATAWTLNGRRIAQAQCRDVNLAVLRGALGPRLPSNLRITGPDSRPEYDPGLPLMPTQLAP